MTPPSGLWPRPEAFLHVSSEEAEGRRVKRKAQKQSIMLRNLGLLRGKLSERNQVYSELVMLR